jgi:hypothetical protein
MYNGMRDFPFPLIPLPECGTAQCAIGPELISIKEITPEPYENVNLNRNSGEISAFNTEDICIPNDSESKKGPKNTQLTEAYPIETIQIDHLPEDLQKRASKVLNTDDFKETPLWREQVGLLCKELRTIESGKRASFDQIARMFGLKNSHIIIAQWEKYQENSVEAGRPSVFNEKGKLHII